eukprot:1138757-Pelagomonas_calceolata.AAC.7
MQAVVPAANHSLPGLSTVPAYNSMPGASSTTNPVSLPNNRHMLLSAGASQAPYMDGIRRVAGRQGCYAWQQHTTGGMHILQNLLLHVAVSCVQCAA